MKLTITRRNLEKGMAAVSASVPTKTTLPVLSNVLIDGGDDRVWISGTDLDVSIRTRVPAEVVQEGSITVPGRKLQELIRELPDDPVDLQVEGSQLEIVCGKSRFKLNGLPSEEFPDLPAVDDGGWFISEDTLRTLVQSTSFAVSTEESRPILNGVCWEIKEDRMIMVATNGHRLAKMVAETEANRNAGTTDLIVPTAALAHVARLFDQGSEINVSRGGNHLAFRAANKEVYTRLVEGRYPNYEQVIPKDNDQVARVDKDAFEAVVRRMAVVASEATRRIKIVFEEGLMRFEVVTPDLGEAYDEVEVDYDGEEMAIGFNASYLLEVLRNMPDGDVRFSFKSGDRAATIEPMDSELDYVCLLMPLRLND